MTSKRLFGRTYQIQVGEVSVNSLRCGFTVKKSLKKSANTAELAIYNLARATREAIAGMSRVPILIEAGYGGDNTLIFRGEMRDAYSRHESDGSWVTVLTAGDGDTALREARTNFGGRPGVSLSRVISQLVNDLGIGIGNAAKALVDGNIDGVGAAFGKGITLSGSSQEELDKLMRSSGKEWSIQDGELQILEAGKALQDSVTVLSPGTGLEGTPEIEDKGDLKGKARIKCRIVPDVGPGRVVQVANSSIANGFWRVDEVTYVGDTMGQDWTAEIVGREYT
jgi:hypothetical protein